MRETILKRIIDRKIIAIMRNIDGENCLAAAEALYNGGIDFIEVTFMQNNMGGLRKTADSIRAINSRFKGGVITGAGTVTSSEMVKMAADAGAGYIISPDTNPDVIRTTLGLGLISIPGAMTPTEIMAAHNAGADFVKLFPAADMGSAYVRAIRAPISHVRMLAVGGINENNIREFLDAGILGFGIGGNLVNRKWIEAGEFNKITDLARKLVACVNEGKGD